jgi:putative protease
LEHQRHLLSLKDLNQSAHLEELIQAGAVSFKIEGRLKDATYVKNVVAAYSQRLDAIIAKHPDQYCRASRGHCTYAFTPNLKKTFNRGFTTYFLHGRQPDIFSPDTPKAMGEFVGTVKELRRDSFNVAGTAAFANGDGLCFINDERELEGFRVNRAEGNRLFPQQMPRHLRPGTALYRNNDMEFERLLSHQSSVRKIPVTLRLDATPDGFSLSGDDVTVTIPCPHQQAEKPQRDNIVRQLSKLGGTIYECSGVELPADFNYFIPSSQLADLRRQWVELYGDGSRNHGDRLFDMNLNQIQSKTCPRDSRPQCAVPHYAYPYLYNISNRQAAAFYGVKEPTAFELNTPSFRRGQGEAPLMQCRHCLQYAMGYCVKHGGQRPTYKQPLSLRLADGRRFRLEFDCRHCQMNVYAE